jgi:hypothetical protein
VADHLAYLPSLGLALAAVGAATSLPVGGRVALVALALWCAVLAVLTWRQVPLWRDTETLWTFTLARNPDCALCHYNLGVLLADRGDLAAAAEHYETALVAGREIVVELHRSRGVAFPERARGRARGASARR